MSDSATPRSLFDSARVQMDAVTTNINQLEEKNQDLEKKVEEVTQKNKALELEKNNQERNIDSGANPGTYSHSLHKIVQELTHHSQVVPPSQTSPPLSERTRNLLSRI